MGQIAIYVSVHPIFDQQLLDFGKCQVKHQTGAVGGAVDGVIVHRHIYTVGGVTHIDLDRICTLVESDFQAGKLVFRGQNVRPAVAGDRKIGIERNPIVVGGIVIGHIIVTNIVIVKVVVGIGISLIIIHKRVAITLGHHRYHL